MSMAASDQFAMKTTTSATVFAFSTQSDLPSGNAITVGLPANYFSGKPQPAGQLSGPGSIPNVTCVMTAAALHVVCTTAGAVLSAGSYNLTFAAGELTTGVAVAANSSGLTVKTSVEN